MKKEEMVSVLAVAGVEPKIIDAMAEAYDMGVEYGAKAYIHLTGAVEAARDVCKYLDHDAVESAKGHTQFFWEHIDKLRDME